MAISYNEYGKDKDKHVLFIHGLGSSSIAWRDIPDALSDYFHTITVDLIGFGRSDKPETADYTIKGFSKFIVDFLTKEIRIGKNEKISIVGHSLGGYIAADVAIENKDLVEKLVLIDSSGMLQKPTSLLNQYLEAAIEEEPVVRYNKLKRVFEQLYAYPSFLPPIVVDIFVQTIVKPGAKNAFVSAFNNSTKTTIGLDRLKQIQDLPCLIIWGKNDNLIPLEYANMFKNALPYAKYEEIDIAGHAPFVEKTASVHEKLRKFLTEDNHKM
jgi:pimeloyl-ACP methyl ester carboxylesterase